MAKLNNSEKKAWQKKNQWTPVLLKGLVLDGDLVEPEDSVKGKKAKEKGKGQQKESHDITDGPHHNPHISPALKGKVEVFYSNLGLGRGIDVTKRQPFEHKTAYQILPVTYDRLIGTEEGGVVKKYVETVQRSSEISAKYSASLDVTKAVSQAMTYCQAVPLAISASCEASRSTTSIRVVVGLRVHNRTVAFWKSMDCIPPKISDSETQKPPKKALREYTTFERELKTWMLEQGYKEDPAASSQCEIDDKLLELCEMYTTHTGITHYVSELRLGGEMYKDISHSEYRQLVKSGTSANVMDIFSSESGFGREQKSILQKHTTNYIGRIRQVPAGPKHKGKGILQACRKTKKEPKDETSETDKNEEPQERALNKDNSSPVIYNVRPLEEAVIGYDLKPVASLIHDPILARHMTKAAKDYIKQKSCALAGPFLIAAHDMKSEKVIYFKCNANTLATTTEKVDASGFKIISSNGHKNEFHIVHEVTDATEAANKDDNHVSFPYYVTTHHNSPPTLEPHPQESNATFTLHSQLHEWFAHSEDMDEWILEGESFLIHCKGRRWPLPSYLGLVREENIMTTPQSEQTSQTASVSQNKEAQGTYDVISPAKDKQKKHGDEKSSSNFIPRCVKYHKADHNILMAFRLVRVTSNKQASMDKPENNPPQKKTSE